MSGKSIWFPAKRYGWGWGLPLTWQGWMVVVLYFVLLGAGTFVFDPDERPVLYVVYTGILKVTQNEDALAVVMGHEIAHALANHGNERVSQGLVAQLGLTSLDLGLAMAQKPAQTRNLIMQAAGVGTQVGVLLPFSRKHESEADEIGLYLMAMAGYNPNEAVPFWNRMNKSGGSRPPEFLSTHPDPSKRAERLKSLVPKAKAYASRYPVPASSKRH